MMNMVELIFGGTNQKGEQEMIAQIPQIKENKPVVSIRGWGSIQYMKLPCKPEEFQDAIGKFVAEAINEKLEKL
jgi:hypothetical protein